jgi:hypothetical protein
MAMLKTNASVGKEESAGSIIVTASGADHHAYTFGQLLMCESQWLESALVLVPSIVRRQFYLRSKLRLTTPV